MKAYEQYHRELYQFGVNRWPNLKSPLETQRDYHLARIKLRDRQFHFLRKNHPERLTTDLTIHDLVHFEWSSEFDTELVQERPAMEQLIEQVNELARENESNSRWPEIRERFQNLETDSKYHQIQSRYQTRLSELDEALQSASFN